MCVKDVMTPRSEVDVMDLTAPFEENWALARESWHTRFPLVEGDHLDEVKGWVHVKDLLKLVGQDNPDLMSVKRELRVVPDTMPLDSLLTFFLKEHAHFALVVTSSGIPSASCSWTTFWNRSWAMTFRTSLTGRK